MYSNNGVELMSKKCKERDYEKDIAELKKQKSVVDFAVDAIKNLKETFGLPYSDRSAEVYCMIYGDLRFKQDDIEERIARTIKSQEMEAKKAEQYAKTLLKIVKK